MGVAAYAFPGFAPSWTIAIGARFLSNAFPLKNGLKSAWVHGYTDIFKISPTIIEGNFLGLVPFYFSGFRWRQPWGYFEAQWVPFEFIRYTRESLGFLSSGAQGTIDARLSARWEIGAWGKIGLIYAGSDGLYRSQTSAGMVYSVNTSIRYGITKRLKVGLTLGVEGLFSGIRDTTATPTDSTWGRAQFDSRLFVARTF